MSTTKDLLFLHLAQAEQSLERAKNNAYSDKRMEVYHFQLSNLFNCVKKELSQGTTFTDAEIYDGPKKYLDFIFKSLEFLDSSTLNQIPYEIVACLEYAMKESIEASDNYIIVTSLINDVRGFSYDPSIAFDNGLYSDIKTKYDIEFKDRLVQINLPRAFARDYISAVVLYHELGHFIDRRFSYMKILTRTVLDKILLRQFDPPTLAHILIYFPYLNNINLPIPSNMPLFEVLFRHFGEYFSDIFAAQYIGEASSYYVKYISSNKSILTTTHPSTTNREKVVSDFTNGTDNIVVKLINESLHSSRGFKLEKRFTEVSPKDFFNLVPTEINTGKELHGLMNIAWKIWLQDREELGKQLNTTDTLKIYTVINNLVEKSIGNFITVNKWTKAYNQLNPPKEVLSTPIGPIQEEVDPALLKVVKEQMAPNNS